MRLLPIFIFLFLILSIYANTLRARHRKQIGKQLPARPRKHLKHLTRRLPLKKKRLIDNREAMTYLSQFGYIAPGNLITTSTGSKSESWSESVSSSSSSSFKQDSWVVVLRSAIVKFQEYAGLEKTGVLDEPTKLKMASPRCGVADVAAVKSGGNILKWGKNRLTYSIENFSPDLSENQIRTAIREAYDTWARETNLDFQEVPAGQGDIKIRFASGKHGDDTAFDGIGHVLAHGAFPENGALHFDEDENWTFMNAAKLSTGHYTDLLSVAIHEGGHTLGLEHSNEKNSIMNPFIVESLDEVGKYVLPKLGPHDIEAIQSIYGIRLTPSQITQAPPPAPMPILKATTKSPTWLWDNVFGMTLKMSILLLMSLFVGATSLKCITTEYTKDYQIREKRDVACDDYCESTLMQSSNLAYRDLSCGNCTKASPNNCKSDTIGSANLTFCCCNDKDNCNDPALEWSSIPIGSADFGPSPDGSSLKCIETNFTENVETRNVPCSDSCMVLYGSSVNQKKLARGCYKCEKEQIGQCFPFENKTFATACCCDKNNCNDISLAEMKEIKIGPYPGNSDSSSEISVLLAIFSSIALFFAL